MENCCAEFMDTLNVIDLTPMKGVKGKKDGGYMGLLIFEVRSWFGTFPLLVRALVSSAADTPIRACRY